MILKNPHSKIALIIDGFGLYGTSKALGIHIDYKKLIEYVAQHGLVYNATYITAIDENDENNPLVPMLDWIEFNGYQVVTKPIKEYTDTTGQIRTKASIAVEMTLAMLGAAEWADQIVLMTGSSDIVPAILEVQRRGCRVTVISSREAKSIADEVRRAASAFIELRAIAGSVCQSQPPAPRFEGQQPRNDR